MSAPSYPPPSSPFREKFFAFNKKMLHENLSFNIDLSFPEEINISSVLQKGFFGVFIPLLSTTVLAKSENSGVKSLGHSPTTESNSSISSLLCFAHNLVYQMWQVIHRTRAPSWTAFVTSRYDMATSVFFNKVQLLSDDPHKAVMNTVQYKRVICIL